MLVIVHGWSDTSRSFRRLGERLVADKVVDRVEHVDLADYISKDDEVTFDDLTLAMERAWDRRQLPRAARSVDVIAHSTGALVVRHWMTRFWTPETNPIHHFVMLGPANFGSPLAHKGRSFIGRVVKGFTSERMFETGSKILHGLELASPYSWNLAFADRFVEDSWYGPGRILGSVIVGTTGYTGISAAANAPGTDGTVRVSTASLDCAYVKLDFSADPKQPTASFRSSNGDVAFIRVPEENHSTVALKDKGPRSARTLALIRAALGVDDAEFPNLCAEWERIAALHRQAAVDAGNRFAHPFQNSVVQVRDDAGQPVPDYFLEIFMKTPAKNVVDKSSTREIQERAIESVHAYGGLTAFRSLHVDVTEIERIVKADPKNPTGRPVYVAVTALPDINRTKTVGYRTVGYDDIGSIEIRPEQLGAFFAPDRTLLVELVLKREQAERVFVFGPLAAT